MNRLECFRNPPPEGWRPLPGERVLVISPFRRAEGTVIRRLLEELYEVQLRFGAQYRTLTFYRDDLRPTAG